MKNEKTVARFETALCSILEARYTGHWYPTRPLRGSGFRSISFENRIDPVLDEAGRQAGLSHVERHLESSRFHIMFINPGQVKLRNALSPSPPTTIWDASEAQPVSKAAPHHNSDRGSNRGSDESVSGNAEAQLSSSQEGVPSPQNNVGQGNEVKTAVSLPPAQRVLRGRSSATLVHVHS